MWMLGPIGFTTPWLLLGLAALPILWVLLRAVPPAPIRRRFPGVALLLGLTDERPEADRTPWWLLLIRMAAIAAAIIAFAGPVLNPKVDKPGTGPLLILTDGSWASARDWQRRVGRIQGLLEEAARAGRPVALVSLTDLPAQPKDGDGTPRFMEAAAWEARLPSLHPQPWAPSDTAVAKWATSLKGRFDTYWLSDGLARDSRAALLKALQSHGQLRVYQSPRPVLALRPPLFKEGAIEITALRAAPGPETQVTVVARGTGPKGAARELAQTPLSFAAGATEASTRLTLPPELRNRINRFEVSGVRSAGAVSLTDDALKRRKVALLGPRDREGLQLLSPLYYLREALQPTADLVEGSFDDILLAAPDVIVLADVAKLSPVEQKELLNWTEKGGLLLRFAGPRLAASDISRGIEDPLMPVRLRIGGRTVGGAMSWGQPKKLRPFRKGSPFYGLTIPGDVTVNAQVLAQPDPTLSERTIASLADGTPLVTRKPVGKGQVVLFHVTANADWSTLPLSGLFVQMLDRLAVSTRPARPTAEEMAGTTWVADRVIDAFGATHDAGQMAGVPGKTLIAAMASPETPPGLYRSDDRRLALNVTGAKTVLKPAAWPGDVVIEGLAVARETLLMGWFLAAALLFFLIDLIASLALSGRLRRTPGAAGTAAAVLLGVALVLAPGQSHAQAETKPGDAFAIKATDGLVLAHVLTGDGQVDRIAQAGLQGLSDILTARTSVEPKTPIGVNIETDELAFFPFLYWPVTADEPIPSAKAYAKLNQYLRTGGMILFDTRDADMAVGGAVTPNAERLRQIALGLDIPPLSPVPKDHVLTRAFYLLQDFPGRYDSGTVWVEAAPPNAKKVAGMPFRNLNDGVTPVVIGSNDWAGAWAVDAQGRPLLPVGRGYAGERQREIADRFGVNLIMYVLTGNYKSDQVHVPALLERLGQ